jgi:hypothetical protein
MDNFNESNSAKSRNGNKLNSIVNDLLVQAYNNGKIKDFVTEPRYIFPNHTYAQFSPDFEITLNDDSIIVIDNTTTARHDRFKQKQWDASGIRAYFATLNKSVRYYVVLPNNDSIGNVDTRDKEINYYIHEKNKNLSPSYFSMIDDIIQLSDLEFILNTL